MPIGHIAFGWVHDGWASAVFDDDLLPALRDRLVTYQQKDLIKADTDDGQWNTLFSASHLDEDAVVGMRSRRYGRTWIMGPSGVDASHGDFWGRIGFQSDESNEVWDEVVGDFTETDSYTGASAPFLVSSQTGRLAFQFRPNLISRTSYCSALASLLNQTYESEGHPPRWRVSPDIATYSDWRSWVEQVGPVATIRASLRLPNPNFEGRPQLEADFQQTNAEIIRIALDTDDPNGLDLDSPLVREVVDHTAERGYGSLTADPARPNEPKFTLKDKPPAAEVTVDLPSGHKNVGFETLRDLISRVIRRTRRRPANPMN